MQLTDNLRNSPIASVIGTAARQTSSAIAHDYLLRIQYTAVGLALEAEAHFLAVHERGSVISYSMHLRVGIKGIIFNDISKSLYYDSVINIFQDKFSDKCSYRSHDTRKDTLSRDKQTGFTPQLLRISLHSIY